VSVYNQYYPLIFQLNSTQKSNRLSSEARSLSHPSHPYFPKVLPQNLLFTFSGLHYPCPRSYLISFNFTWCVHPKSFCFNFFLFLFHITFLFQPRKFFKLQNLVKNSTEFSLQTRLPIILNNLKKEKESQPAQFKI